MRYTEPKLNRDFRCPLMPVTPAIAILLAIYIMSSYPLLVYLNACTVLVILTFLYFINSRFRAHK